MSAVDRNQINIFLRILLSIKSLFRLLIDCFSGTITFKQFLLDLRFRLISSKAVEYDDFDWEKYPEYYREELKSIGRKHQLIISKEDYSIIDGELESQRENLKPLHPNHKILYEVIQKISPKSILEIGCGGGDHLANLLELNHSLAVSGIDRSEGQLEILKKRHSNLKAKIFVADITRPLTVNITSELVFSQAVLMHISESEGRFESALENMFMLATDYLVLVENWTQHDFFAAINRIMAANSDWKNARLYFKASKADTYSSALVISRNQTLDLQKLVDYSELLAGRPLLTH